MDVTMGVGREDFVIWARTHGLQRRSSRRPFRADAHNKIDLSQDNAAEKYRHISAQHLARLGGRSHPKFLAVHRFGRPQECSSRRIKTSAKPGEMLRGNMTVFL